MSSARRPTASVDNDQAFQPQTSPIFRGLVLDRVHLRKPENSGDLSAGQEEGKTETLGCRTLPSVSIVESWWQP